MRKMHDQTTLTWLSHVNGIFFFIVKNCEFTIYSYGAISKCGEGEDDERE